MSSLTLKERFSLSRFSSGEKASDEPITLNQRRIFILPTDRGLGFVILLALLLLIAFVYNNNLAYLLAFLLASIFFITILHSYRSLSGLVLRSGQSKPVFAGQAAGFNIHIDNLTNKDRLQLKINLLQATETISLSTHSQTQITLHSATYKRGWQEAGTLTISSTYPLGLFRAWSPLRFNLKVLIYPKPANTGIPFPESSASQSEQGAYSKGNDDFFGLQSYQPGDAIKHIHWKSYAKGLGVFSKQYDGESSAQIWLDYIQTPGHGIEERLSQLCRWLIDAEQAGISYGFSIPGLKIEPANGQHHYQKCLEALALFETS
ncbi:MAG: DUF58 domain-containing protein [Methylococcaceae bacterium]|nr:DUF58 domain-containing protein [Methylococcaceae bacterium]